MKTTIKDNALCGTWHFDDVDEFKLSPLIIFDAHEKLKIIFRLKAQKRLNEVEAYFIQTSVFYGVLPKNFTISVGKNLQLRNVVKFVADKSWKKIAVELPSPRGSPIDFKIELPRSDISKLYSPENNFSNLLEEPDADITIEASDGKQKNVHKTVLLARSDVLRAMWRKDMLESKTNHLKILELDEGSLNLFVSYLYHGTIGECNLNEGFTLLNMGDKYNIKHLLIKCQNILQDKLCKDNVICIFLNADLHNLPNLKALAVEYALENIEVVASTRAWSDTNDASFFKCVFEDLVETRNRVIIVGEILQSIKQLNQCIRITFPFPHRSDKSSQMIVSPEVGNGTFIFKVSKKDANFFKLSVCQCKDGVSYRYTNAKFSVSIFLDTKHTSKHTYKATKHTSFHVPEIITYEWYNSPLLRTEKQLQTTIILEMSYDIKYNPKNCAFMELLTDSNSADMTLESSDGIFRQVHKSVLIARNLRAMVHQCDSKDHLKFNNLSALALNEFINFIYIVNNEELHVDYCAELLAIAHKYDLPAMKYECEAKLKTLISIESALELLSLAVLNEAIFLEQCLLVYIHLNKQKLIKTENWRNFYDGNSIKKIVEHHLTLEKLSKMETSPSVPSLSRGFVGCDKRPIHFNFGISINTLKLSIFGVYRENKDFGFFK